jgi:hypothetical protein
MLLFIFPLTGARKLCILRAAVISPRMKIVGVHSAVHGMISLQECDREFGMDAKHANCLMIREQPSFLRAADASLWRSLKHC